MADQALQITLSGVPAVAVLVGILVGVRRVEEVIDARLKHLEER